MLNSVSFHGCHQSSVVSLLSLNFMMNDQHVPVIEYRTLITEQIKHLDTLRDIVFDLDSTHAQSILFEWARRHDPEFINHLRHIAGR